MTGGRSICIYKAYSSPALDYTWNRMHHTNDSFPQPSRIPAGGRTRNGGRLCRLPQPVPYRRPFLLPRSFIISISSSGATRHSENSRRRPQ